MIVIVVIAVLATISIVAYNGIQARARNSESKQAATQLHKKIELFKVFSGQYPIPATETTNGAGADLAAAMNGVEEAQIDISIQEKIHNYNPSQQVLSSEVSIDYYSCGSGASITYWQSGEPADYGRIELSLDSCS